MPGTLNPQVLATDGNSVSNNNLAPRRRRAGDDQEQTEKSTVLGREERKIVADPFANVDMVLKPNASTNVGLKNQPAASTNKPISYEQKLQNEVASRGSFLDMIGGGGNNSKPAEEPKNSQPQMKMM